MRDKGIERGNGENPEKIRRKQSNKTGFSITACHSLWHLNHSALHMSNAERRGLEVEGGEADVKNTSEGTIREMKR